MKKLTSLFAAIIMAAILCANAVPAFAVEPWPERSDFKEPLTYVNGMKSNDIYADGTDYRYLGGGTVTGWEFPTLDRGVDYEIIKKGDDNITIKLLNGNKTVPYINVIVAFESWPVRVNVQDITAFINGKRCYQVLATLAPKGEAHRLTYTGEGTVTGWEFPSMTEGKHYEIAETKDNYIDIKLINGQDEIPDVNVLVDFRALAETIDAEGTVCVNGEKNKDITCAYNKYEDSYTYKYIGDGKVTEWDFSDLVENMNYQILENGINEITVKLMNGQEKIDYVNAAVTIGEEMPDELVPTEQETADDPPAYNNIVLYASAAAIVVILIGAVILFKVKKKK